VVADLPAELVRELSADQAPAQESAFPSLRAGSTPPNITVAATRFTPGRARIRGA
jgi:hypothetical protein